MFAFEVCFQVLGSFFVAPEEASVALWVMQSSDLKKKKKGRRMCGIKKGDIFDHLFFNCS